MWERCPFSRSAESRSIARYTARRLSFSPAPSRALPCCAHRGGGPSTSVKLPASSALQTSSGEGQRAAKCLHKGPTQQPSQRKTWACNSNKCTVTAKTSHRQHGQLCSFCNSKEVSSAAAIQPQGGEVWHQTITSHQLLWCSRRQCKKGAEECLIFHSFDLLLIFPSLLFTSQIKLLWCARWAAFIATSLKGCWLRFLSQVCISFWEGYYQPLW